MFQNVSFCSPGKTVSSNVHSVDALLGDEPMYLHLTFLKVGHIDVSPPFQSPDPRLRGTNAAREAARFFVSMSLNHEYAACTGVSVPVLTAMADGGELVLPPLHPASPIASTPITANFALMASS